MAPSRFLPSGGRNLPLAIYARKGRNVNLHVSRFIGGISDPSAIWRKLCVSKCPLCLEQWFWGAVKPSEVPHLTFLPDQHVFPVARPVPGIDLQIGAEIGYLFFGTRTIAVLHVNAKAHLAV